MYFGSVRFYKHLLLILILIAVIFSITSCVFMSVSNNRMKQALEESGINISNSSVQDDMTELSAKEKRAQYYLTSFEYQNSYPQLYINNTFVYREDNPKSIYLTFDDGPSSLTSQILDILKEKGVKATFFINYNDSLESQALYKRMVSEGHSIGVHSTCHQYATIYQSTEAFLDDFAQTALMLEQFTGIKPEIFRFPGGSINSYNKAIYQQLIAEMTRRGYTYYDWNVSSDDATSTTTQAQIYDNVINGVQKYNKSIVLMHDAGNKFDTLSALPSIIDNLKNSGYSFYSITKEVRPVTFDYID